MVFITLPFKLTFPYFSSIFQPHTNDIIFSLFRDFFNTNFFSFPLSYNGVISKTTFQVIYNFSNKIQPSFIFYLWIFNFFTRVHTVRTTRPFASFLTELLALWVESLLLHFRGGRSPWGATAAILFARRGPDFHKYSFLHALHMRHSTCLSVVKRVLRQNSASAIPFRKFLHLFKLCFVQNQYVLCH